MAYIKVYATWLPYGRMKDPRGFISKQFGAGHTGVDSVGNEYGNSVCAVMDGYVTRVSCSNTLGNMVEYAAGGVRFALYHLAKVNVSVGASVKKGDILGVEGATGSLATGKHLHTSMWINDVLVDPEPYLSGEKEIITSTGGNTMAICIGDKVKASGKLAPSAYSNAGTAARADVLTVKKIYSGTNYPYELAVSGGTTVGFAKASMLSVQDTATVKTVSKAEYDKVVAERDAALAKVKAAKAQAEALLKALS